MYGWKQIIITRKTVINVNKKKVMKKFDEKNFEMMKRFALSSVEMINVRGGDGEGGEDGGDDSDPERPPIGIKV
jgi:hypothetical protein